MHGSRFFFKNIFDRVPYDEITPKHVLNFIKNKDYLKASTKANVADLEKIEHLYFLLVQFRGASTNLSLYYWNPSQQEIQNCYDPSEVFLDLKKVSTSYYDFIAFIRTNEIETQEASTMDAIRLSLKPETNIQNIKRFRFLKLSKKPPVIWVLKFEVSKTSSNVDGLEI